MKHFDQFEPIFFTSPHNRGKFEERRLHKGGGGGDGGAAARKAEEDQRIAAAVKRIDEIFGNVAAKPADVDRSLYTKQVAAPVINNGYMGMGSFQQNNNGGLSSFLGGNRQQTQSVFDQAAYDAAVAQEAAKAKALNDAAKERETLYGKIGEDAKNNALIDINEESSDAARELKFILARAGLAGGSRDIDSNKDLLDVNNRGVLKASNMGLQTANTARSNDESTRVNLINSIHAGLSSGDAQSQAYAGLKNNASRAADDANNANLAGFFDVIRSQNEKRQYNAGVNSVGTDFGKTKSKTSGSGSPGSNGTINSF